MTYSVSGSNRDVGDLLQQFIAAHSFAQCTTEMKMNNQIPILYLLLIRKAYGRIQRSVYKQNSWTRQYTNFHRSNGYPEMF